MGQNGPYFQRFIIQLAQIIPNGLSFVQSGSKWAKMAENGPKWLKMGQNNKMGLKNWLNLINGLQNGPKTAKQNQIDHMQVRICNKRGL